MTAKPKRVKVTLPPGRCVFCNGTGMTKEHIWSDWLSEVLPDAPEGHKQATIHEHTDHAAKKIWVQPFPPKSFESGLHKRKTRNVCLKCNGGWMSRIVADAKPFAKALIEDKTPMLTQEAQQSLATWITIASTMAEFTDKKSAGVSQDDRRYLWQKHEPPSNWTICIGRYGGTGKSWSPMRYRHHGAHAQITSPRPSAIPRSEIDTYQITTYTLRSLLVFAFSCTRPDIVAMFRQRWIPVTMVCIWPRHNDITWPPGHTLGDGDVEQISNALHNYMLALGRPR